MAKRSVIALALCALLAASCAGTVEVAGNDSDETVQRRPTPQSPEPTAIPPAATAVPAESEPQPVEPADCSEGWVPLLAGTSSARFSAVDADAFPNARVAVCENDDRDLELMFREVDSTDVVRLPACQESPDVWRATNGDTEYQLVDERNSAGSALSVFNEFGSDDFVTMKLEADIVRTVERQNRLGAPFCEGSQRLCTYNVGTNEVLNLRDIPSLDGSVLAEIPGGSCTLWQNLKPSEQGQPGVGWVSVVTTLPDTDARITGWVSSDFVDAATPDLVLDAFGVATVPFGMPWTEALAALEVQLGVPDELTTYDTCGNPGETQHRASWDNLVVLAHAPVEADPTDAPVLAWASLTEGQFSGISGLGSGSLWSQVVAALPNATPLENEWGIMGQSHEYELDFDSEVAVGTQWAEQNYFEFWFVDAITMQSTDDVQASSRVAGMSAGHTWKDC